MEIGENEATLTGPSELNPKTTQEAVSALASRFAAATAETDEAESEEELDSGSVLDEEVTGEEEEYSETVEEDDEEQAEVDEEQDDGEGEEASFSSVGELLEAGGVNASDVTVTVKVAGQESEVTLEEAVRGYQRQADYDRHMKEVREAREEIQHARDNIFENEEVQNKLRVFDEAFEVASMIINADANAVQQRYDSIDWGKLRVEDRHEYAALQADFQQEQRRLEAAKQQWGAAYQSAVQARQKDQQERINKLRVTERQRLVERVPEWGDDSSFESGIGEVYNYLHATYGATEKELDGLFDHRILDLARKARLYDEATATGARLVNGGKPKKGKKKVTRTLKPGANVASIRNRGRVREDTEARERLAKSHRAEDAVAVLSNRFRQRT